MISNLTVTTEKRRQFLASMEETFRTPEGSVADEKDPIKAAVLGYETAEAIYEAQSLILAEKLRCARTCVKALLKVKGVKKLLAEDEANAKEFIEASMEAMSLDFREKEHLRDIAEGMGILQTLFKSDALEDQEKIKDMLKTLKKEMQDGTDAD